MPIKKALQAYAGFSKVFGQHGDPLRMETRA
jgi:hypothetical protein